MLTQEQIQNVIEAAGPTLVESLKAAFAAEPVQVVKKAAAHPKELSKITNAAENFLPAGAFIAGGALTSAFTNTEIKDVDLYFKTKAAFIEAIEQAYDEGLWCLAATDRAVTFANGESIVQLMHFDYFPTADAVFDAFDFTVCMAAYDIDEKTFVFHDDFLKHAAQRFLRFHSGTRYPFGSLLRVLKYQQRGYTIGKGDLLRIALCCHQVDLNSWDDLARAIGGQYGEKVKIDADQPFSIEAALAMFDDAEIMVAAESEEMPGNAEDLLATIGVTGDHAETPQPMPAFPLPPLPVPMPALEEVFP
ncbi:hypothetical protein [Massilia varians]